MKLLLLSLIAAAALQAPPIDFSKFQPYTPTSGEGDYIINPTYQNAPELTADPSVPKGNITRFVMDSHDSVLFPGIAKSDPGHVVPYTRRVTVYVPSQYVPGSAAPFF